MTLAVGNILDGVVTGITKFGAFVKLENGATGLVHISEVADTYVKEVADFLKEGDKVKVKVLNMGDNQGPKKNTSFEDKLAEFMKDSNEKLTALKRHQEGRRR